MFEGVRKMQETVTAECVSLIPCLYVVLWIIH